MLWFFNKGELRLHLPVAWYGGLAGVYTLADAKQRRLVRETPERVALWVAMRLEFR